MIANNLDHKGNPTLPAYDELANIIAYEQGELEDDAIIELFQHLVDTGLAWKLQGSYGRAAHSLIQAGLVHLPSETLHPEGWDQ
jgi:hypothetical protein